MIGAAYLFQGPGQSWMQKKSRVKNILSGIKIEDADKIEIDAPSGKNIFEKKDGKWKIVGTKDFYLAADKFQGFADGLKEGITADFSVVSENANKKKDFNVDDKGGVKVKISQENKVLGEFVIGKMTSDYSGVYISKLSDANTYSVKAVSLSSAFAGGDWYDKTIFSSDKDKIAKIRFQDSKKKSEFTVEKKDGKWVGIKPSFKVGDGKLDKALDVISNLSAMEIPEQKFDKTGLDKQPYIVQASGEGIDNTIMIGNDNGKGLFYAKRGNSDNIYLVAKSNIDDLKATMASLK